MSNWLVECLVKFHKYKNCANECLLNRHVHSEIISDIFYIPVLHTIKLGPVNKIYKELSTKVDLKDFEVSHSIYRDDYHGVYLERPQIKYLVILMS